MNKIKTMPVSVWGIPLVFLLAACGDDGEGNNDTLLTGFSGLVIVVIVGYLLYRWFAKNRG